MKKCPECNSTIYRGAPERIHPEVKGDIIQYRIRPPKDGEHFSLFVQHSPSELCISMDEHLEMTDCKTCIMTYGTDLFKTEYTGMVWKRIRLDDHPNLKKTFVEIRKKYGAAAAPTDGELMPQPGDTVRFHFLFNNNKFEEVEGTVQNLLTDNEGNPQFIYVNNLAYVWGALSKFQILERNYDYYLIEEELRKLYEEYTKKQMR